MEHFDAIAVLSVFSVLLLAEYLTGISRKQRRNTGAIRYGQQGFDDAAMVLPAMVAVGETTPG